MLRLADVFGLSVRGLFARSSSQRLELFHRTRAVRRCVCGVVSVAPDDAWRRGFTAGAKTRAGACQERRHNGN